MRMKTAAAVLLALAAAGARAGDQDFYYKDFYLGMPLGDFKTTFGDEATLTGDGTYAYAGYADEGVELVFADVLGSPRLTSITVNAVVDYAEEVLPTLVDLYGEPEYDSRWVPAHTDCNDGAAPVRSASWFPGVDVDLTMTALENFEGPEPPAGSEVECRFELADGSERDGPHPWLEKKLGPRD